MTEEKLTGYPSIDRPWLRYYTKEQLNRPIHNCTAFEHLYACNREHMDDVALNYYGKKTNYKSLFQSIDAVAQSLYATGVRENDIVIMCMVNTPEMVYVLYALNCLGAVCNLVDPRTNPDALRGYINECNCKLVISIDKAYPLIKKAVVNSSAEEVILISPADSLPITARIIYNIKNPKQKVDANQKVLLWKQFMKVGTDATAQYAQYVKARPFIMVHTGGTTGSAKTVVLSDDNLNAVCHGYESIQIPIHRQQKFFNDLPPFIIYGLSFAMHTTLCRGLEVVLYPVFDSKAFPKQLMKYKPAHFCALPDHIKHMCNDKRTQRADLSFLITAGVGGDSLDLKLEKTANEFLKAHGSKYEVMKGYGMSEMGATVVTSMNKINSLSSVGIPLIDNNIRIVDTNTQEELQYNKTGEIWLSGPSMMLGYYKNPKATAETIFTDEQGCRWIKTGDLGYITEDGLLFHQGRIRRIYYTLHEQQPAKIFPVTIEETINKNPYVETCCVVGRKKTDCSSNEAIAYLVVNQRDNADQQKLIEDLQQLCKEELPTYMLPVEYRFVDELPHTPIGKVDFRKLEDWAAKKE